MDWTIRIIQEQKVSESAHFLTLTYEDDYLDYSPSGLPQLCKEHLQKFFKRLRRENEKHTQKSIRYFAIGEYGETFERPHYHAIAFNIHDRTIQKLHTIWPVGFYRMGTVQVASIHYVTGYLMDRFNDYGDRNPPFAVQSRKPGLGAAYLDKRTIKWHNSGEDERFWKNYTKIGGYTNRLPRYYRDKIFSKEQRELLNWTAALEYDAKFEAELKRLATLYPGEVDIHEVFKQRVKAQHDSIKIKKNPAL